MRRFLLLSLLLTALATVPAHADPGITVRYEDELLRVTLDGSYAGNYYRVWRSGELIGQYDYLASQFALCTGDCFLTDQEAIAGKTYYYRFDLQAPSGELVSYGPYAVTVPITPVAARVWPNPSNGRAQIVLSVPGSTRRDTPLQAQALLVDLQGRTMRMLHSGPLARGETSLAWDGRDDAGQALRAGVYFIRLTTPLGASTTRLLRVR
ncbi:MAG: FlgD immunoglobulin-like domain containing protein [Candidatus Eisenbacteria bacterium]